MWQKHGPSIITNAGLFLFFLFILLQLISLCLCTAQAILLNYDCNTNCNCNGIRITHCQPVACLYQPKLQIKVKHNLFLLKMILCGFLCFALPLFVHKFYAKIRATRCTYSGFMPKIGLHTKHNCCFTNKENLNLKCFLAEIICPVVLLNFVCCPKNISPSNYRVCTESDIFWLDRERFCELFVSRLMFFA